MIVVSVGGGGGYGGRGQQVGPVHVALFGQFGGADSLLLTLTACSEMNKDFLQSQDAHPHTPTHPTTPTHPSHILTVSKAISIIDAHEIAK